MDSGIAKGILFTEPKNEESQFKHSTNPETLEKQEGMFCVRFCVCRESV
jgi:hypothetical protein